MCTGAEYLLMGGQVAGGLSKMAYGNAMNDLAKADAAYIRDEAQQKAVRIRRAGLREQGAARAATAGNGTRIDQFALDLEREIALNSEQDAAMTVLSGEQQAMATEFSGKMKQIAGQNEFAGSLFSAGVSGYSGWRKTKDPVGDFYQRGTRGAGD